MAKLKYKDGDEWKSIAPSQEEFDLHKLDYANNVFKIKNEIINGDFSDGISNWETNLKGSISIIDGRLVYTVGEPFDSSYLNQTITLNTSHVYYVSADIYAEQRGEVIIRLGGNDLIRGAYTEIGKWSSFSEVGIPPNTGYLRIFVRTGGWDIGDTFKMSPVFLIDLTATFGAGNEPTKAEMDELTDLIGWFDGETILEQKQIVTWQLNLIRQNRNAIISLGGTIV